ncbi:MAG: methyltransferase domain-containing protein [Boseongicola sp.]|nr:methyltransferase domain-containing protein [Boseongicola sp.]MYH58670.1 methyltransferase domain-containing protein [Boseongicola sp. SB0675_bin_26]
MEKAGAEARRAAVAAMTSVTDRRQLLDIALARAAEGLDPPGRARAGRLATGALRWAGRSDRVLGPCLKRLPESRVMNLLRLAVFEMFVELAPAHAVVNQSVSLAPHGKTGLVNAVLRNVLRNGPDWDSLPLPGLPKWLRRRLVDAWGRDAVLAMEAEFAAGPKLDLTLRDSGEEKTWAKRLGAVLRPDGGIRLVEPRQVSALPGYADGAWWVQDAGAAVAARVLDARPGEAVLDLCCAPGGKTLQLAASGAEVTALDVSLERMARVEENLARTGLAATCIVADALNWTSHGKFDAILVDAPCSGTGTLRRHPDLVFVRDGSGIDELVELQAKLIDRALLSLRPGGRLVLCTCSLLPEEGEEQVGAALSRHPDLSVAAPLGDWIDNLWRTQDGMLRIRPDHWRDEGGIDGFFVARLEKRP